MDLYSAMRVAGSGLEVQRSRLNVTAQNLANTNTTQTPEGGPYRAKQLVVETEAGGRQGSFEAALQGFSGGGVDPQQARVQEIRENDDPPRMVYEPDHPHANDDGYVAYPDIDRSTQMVDMMEASRAYQANATTVSAARNMALRALQIGRG